MDARGENGPQRGENPAARRLVGRRLDLGPRGSAARGRYLAAFQYSFVASGIICPVFFTTLCEAGPELPWLVLGVVNVVALRGTYFFERSLRGSAPAAEGPVARTGTVSSG